MLKSPICAPHDDEEDVDDFFSYPEEEDPKFDNPDDDDEDDDEDDLLGTPVADHRGRCRRNGRQRSQNLQPGSSQKAREGGNAAKKTAPPRPAVAKAPAKAPLRRPPRRLRPKLPAKKAAKKAPAKKPVKKAAKKAAPKEGCCEEGCKKRFREGRQEGRRPRRRSKRPAKKAAKKGKKRVGRVVTACIPVGRRLAFGRGSRIPTAQPRPKRAGHVVAGLASTGAAQSALLSPPAARSEIPGTAPWP